MANIKLNIVTSANLAALDKLKAELREVNKLAVQEDGILSGEGTSEVIKVTNAVNVLERALRAAYDVKLNTINIEKFNKSLKSSNVTLRSLYQDLSKVGAEGKSAFLQMTNATMKMGRSIKQTNALVQEMQTTMKNTIKWGISSGLWNTMTSSVSQAYGYVKGLNSDLNDIRIVTGKSADQMERFAKTANKAAKELAVSTRDYTQGALIYYQQGDNDETVAEKTAITAKTSNVTGQDMGTVSEQLTAVWNGYQVANEAAEEGIQVYEEYVDKMAAVGAETASDLEELATAMSKVASAASSMGVDFDQLTAQIATIVSVTRQAPESVGTALKTIYARLGDLKVDGVDEFGTKLGEVSSQLQTMGVDVLDSNGEMREMGDVMTEVAGKWNTWTSAQKEAAAVAMAGKRQYNNLIALFDNWDMYGESLQTSMEASGTLSEQQGIALDSLENKMDRMTTAAEKFYDALFDDESVGLVIEGLTGIIDTIANLTQGLGGLTTILPLVGGMLLKSFGKDIGKSFAKNVGNLKTFKLEKDNENSRKELVKKLEGKGDFLKEDNTEDELMEKEQDRILGFYKDMSKYTKNMTEEEVAQYNAILDKSAALSDEKFKLEETLKDAKGKNELITEEINLLQKANIEDSKLSDKEKEQIKNLREKTKAQADFQKKLGDRGIIDSITVKKMDASKIDGNKKLYGALKTEMKSITNNKSEAEGLIDILIENIKTSIEKGLDFELILEEIQDDLEKEISEESKNILKEAYSKSIKETNIKDLIKDFPDEQINNLQAKIEELTNKGVPLKEAYAKALKSIGIEAEEANKILNQLDENIANQENLEVEMKGMKETADLEASMESLANAAGGATLVFGGLTGAYNALQAATDPTLSSTERLEAAFLGMGTSAASIISGIVQVANAVKMFKDAMDGKNLVESASLAIEALAEKIQKIRIKQLKEENKELKISNDLIGKNSKKRGKNAVATGAQNMAETAGDAANKAKDAADALDNVGDAAQVAGVGMGAGAGATGGLASALGQLAVAAGPVLIALAAVAVVVGVVVVAIHQHQKALEEKAEADKKALKIQQQVTQAAKEEKNAIDEVVISYKSLAEQVNEGTLSQEELRAKTVELCNQHNQHDLAVKALISDYEDLNNIMENAQFDANETYVNERKNERELTTNSVASTMWANAGMTTRDEVGGESAIDIIDGIWADSQEKEIKKILNDYGVETKDGHAMLDDFAEAAIIYGDEFKNAIANVGGDISLDLVNLIDSAGEQIGVFQEGVEEFKKAAAQLAIGEAGEITSANEYAEVVEKITQDLIDEGVYKEEERDKAREYASSQVMAENPEYAIDYEIALKLADTNKTGDEWTSEVDKIFGLIQNYSDDEKNYIALHFTGEADKKELDNFVEDNANTIEYNALKSTQSAIKGIWASTNENTTELTDNQIDSLFQNTDEIDGYNKEEFELFDYNKQMLILNNYYDIAEQRSQELSKYVAEEQEKIANNAEENLKGLRGPDWKSFIQNDNNLKSGSQFSYINYYEKVNDESGFNLNQIFSQIKTELSKNPDVSVDDLIEEYRNRYNIFDNYYTEIIDLNDETIEAFSQGFKDYQKDYQDYDKIMKDASNASAKAAAEQQDYSDKVEETGEQVKKTLTSLKDFSSEFKTLKGIVEEYNENGALTIDSLIALTNMSDEMIACLQIENGQMKINADMAKQVAVDKIKEAQARMITRAETQKQNILNQTAAEAEEAAAKTTNTLTEEQMKLAAAAGQAGFMELFLADATGQATDAQMEQIKSVGTLLEAQMISMNNSIKEIMSGDFSSITGDTDDKDERENKELKVYEEEFELFKDLEDQVEKTAEAYEKLKDASSDLTGLQLLENLKDQKEALADQKDILEDLIAKKEKYLASQRKELSTQGVSFDQDGNVANYEEATRHYLDTYNKAVNDYNSGAISEEQFEAVEKWYEERKKALDDYISSNEGLQNTKDELQDINDGLQDISYEEWQTEIQLKIDTNEAKRDWDAFMDEANEDFKMVFKDLDADLNLSESNSKSYEDDLKTKIEEQKFIENEAAKIKAGGTSEVFGSGDEGFRKAQEAAKKTQDDIINIGKNAFEEYQNAYQIYLDQIDQSAKKFAEHMEQYDRLNKELEYQKEIIELIYGPEAYDLMDDYYNAQKEVSSNQIKSLTTQYETYKELYKNAEEGSEEQKKYYDLMNDAQDNLNASITDYIKLIQDEYKNTVAKTIEDLQKNMYGGKMFEDVEEEWTKALEKSEEYYNSVEKIYQKQSLKNSIESDIAKMTDIKAQQKLQKALDQELKTLDSIENLREEDLEIAKAKLEVTKAEIALQDSLSAKNTMKLTRGADGNWSYQYVADMSNYKEKQQELLDASNNYYEVSQKAYNDSVNKMLDLQKDFLKSFEEISNDMTLSTQERNDKLKQLEIQYSEDMKLITDENARYKDNVAMATADSLYKAYEQDKINYDKMTAEEKLLMDGLKEHNITSVQEIGRAFYGEEEGSLSSQMNKVATESFGQMNTEAQNFANNWIKEDGYSPQIQGAIKSIESASIELDTELLRLKDNTNEYFSSDKDGITTNLSAAASKAKGINTNVTTLAKTVKEKLPETKEKMEKFKNRWNSIKTAVTNAKNEITEFIKKVSNIKSPPPVKIITEYVTKGNPAVADGTGSGGNNLFSDDDGDKTPSKKKYVSFDKDINLSGDNVFYENNPMKTTSHGGSQISIFDYNTKTKKFKGVNGDPASVQNKQGFQIIEDRGDYVLVQKGDFKGWTLKKNLVGYDTGGYTGVWNDYNKAAGKLALLHEKELVLNKDDTKNILDAVSQVRQLKLETLEMSIKNSLEKSLYNAIKTLTPASYLPKQENEHITQQIFNIDAEFPNANNAAEIREAILSLPGLASQKVGLKFS